MRVLRLDLSSGVLDLHPFTTVARGLAPSVRAELLDVLAGIPSGRAPVTGLVEAHGVLLDLTPENLALLDLDTPLLVVVTAEDLPGAPAPETAALAGIRARVRAAEQALRQAEAEVERSEAALETAGHVLAASRGEHRGPGADSGPESRRAAVAAAEADRVEAERAEAAAAAALAAADRAVLDAEVQAREAREARAVATRALSVAAAALDAAADRRDTAAVASVETARERVAGAEAALAAVRNGVGPASASREEHERPVATTPPPTENRDDGDLEALRAERLELEAAVLALETPDPFPVQLALEQIEAGAPVELVTPPEAIALADRWTALAVELDAVTTTAAAAGAGQGDRRVAALARVRAAQAEVEAAEMGDRPGGEPASLDLLEAAHAEVLEAREAAARRIGARQAKRRLEAALAAEQALLDRLGLVTYVEYLMGGAGTPAARSEPDHLAAAREELVEAQAALRAIDDETAGDLRRAELLVQRRAMRAAAADLVGSDPGDDVEGALRRHRVRAEGTGGSGRLALALEAVGVVIGDEELPERFLVDLAKVWLDEQNLVSSQQQLLQARVAELDVRIADRQRAETNPAPAAQSVLAQSVATLEEAKAVLRSAEARASRHAKSEAEVVERRLAFEAAAAEEASAVVAVGQAEAVVLRADEARRRAVHDLDAAKARVASAAAAAAQVADELAALETKLAPASPVDESQLEDGVARAEADLAAARAEAAERARQAGESRAALVVAEADQPESGRALSDAQAQAAVEDAEWYLLARLAAQRAVSYCGSVPLVLDDALARLDPTSSREILDRLERMAATVQVVVVTEDLLAATWASHLGPERAAVVEVA